MKTKKNILGSVLFVFVTMRNKKFPETYCFRLSYHVLSTDRKQRCVLCFKFNDKDSRNSSNQCQSARISLAGWKFIVVGFKWYKLDYLKFVNNCNLLIIKIYALLISRSFWFHWSRYCPRRKLHGIWNKRCTAYWDSYHHVLSKYMM